MRTNTSLLAQTLVGLLSIATTLTAGETRSRQVRLHTLPVAFDQRISGTIQTPAENDRFTFQGIIGQRLYFDAVRLTTQGIVARITTPSGLNRWGDWGVSSDYGPIYLPETGTYTVTIDGYGEAAGDYEFRLVDPGSAPTLTFGQVLGGHQGPTSLTTIYRFNGKAGQRLSLDSVSSSTSGANWWLIGPANQALLQGNITWNLGETVLPTDGEYLLLIAGYEDNPQGFDYQVRVSLVSNPTGTPTGFGQVRTGDVFDSPVTYEFTAPAGLWVWYDDLLRNNAPINFELRHADDTFVLGGSTTGDRGPLLLPKSGTYRLKVQGYGGGQGGAYKFRLVDLTHDAQPYQFGTVLTQPEVPVEQVQVWHFDGSPGQRLYVDGVAAGFNGEMWLFAPSGAWILAGGWYLNQDSGPYILGEPGTYNLLVATYSTDVPPQLRLLDLAQPPVADLALNTQISGQLAPWQRLDAYRFSGTAGQRLFIEGQQPLGGANLLLYGPLDQYLGGVNIGSYWEPQLPWTGTYTLVVQAYMVDPPSYSFRVLETTTNLRPLTLGAVTSGTLATTDQEDRYTFQGTTGQRLYYDALQNDFAPINVRLLRPDGNIEGMNGNSDSDMGPFTLTQDGVYALVFGGYSPATGDYRFRLIDTAQAPALNLPLGSQVDGNLDPGLSTMVYRFQGSAGQFFFLDNLNSNPNGWISLSRPDNQIIVGAGLSGDAYATLPVEGTYLLILATASIDPVSYSFRATAVFPPKTPQPLVFGATQSGRIAQPGEQHSFIFNGSVGQRVYYDTLMNLPDNLPVRLIAPSGGLYINQGAHWDAGPVYLSETGPHTVVMGGLNDVVGDYKFRMLDLDQAPELTLGAVTSGALDPGNRVDAYRFHAEAGQRFLFESISAGSPFANWRLIGPQCQGLFGNSISGNLGPVTVPTSGEHVILVEGNRDLFDPLTYQFKASNVSDAPVATVGFGVVHTGQVSQDQPVTLNLSAPEGLLIYFDSLTTENAGTATLYDPDGTAMFGTNLGGDQQWIADCGPFVLTKSGAYKLVIQGQGSYKFRLLDLSTSASLVLGQVYEGTLAPIEVMAHRFSSPGNQLVHYDSLIAFLGKNASVSLYSETTGWVAWGMAYVQSDSWVWNIPLAGDCWLFFQNWQIDPVDYRFRFMNLSGADAQPIQLDTTYGGGLEIVPASALNLTGSYVNQCLRSYLPQDDWRQTQTIAGTRHDDTINFWTETWGNRADVGVTGGSDQDWEAFSVQWDGTITITKPNTRLYTRSDDGSRFWVDIDRDGVFDEAGPEFVNNNWGNAQGLTYSPASEALAPGTYTIRIQYEEGNYGSAMFLLQDQGVSIGAYESLAFRFTAPAGRLFFNSFEPLAGPAGGLLIGPGGQQLSGVSLGADGEFTLPKAGDYVLCFQNNMPNGLSYGFRLVTPDTITAPLTLGATTSGTLSEPGEEHRYTFAGTAGQRLFYDALENDFAGVWVQILMPSGAVWYYNNSDYDWGLFTLPESGIYTVVQHNTSDIPATYKFRVIDAAAAPWLNLDQVYNATLDPGLGTTIWQFRPARGMRLYLDAQSSSTPAVIGIWNSYGALSSGWFSDQEIVTQNDTPHFLVLQGASTDPVPFTFRVLPGNHQPTLPALGNLSLDEETSLNINTGATDFESSNDVLAYSLGAGAPTGMSIDSATGKLTWTPTDLQGQGQYQVTVIVQDDGVPPLRDSRTFSITVNEVNEKPVLAAIPDFTLDEGGTVSFQASATDGDLPAQPLAYSLGAGAPAGASIDSATGQFLWKTTEAQGPGEHQVTVVVTDTDPGAINGEHLTDSKTFKVTVNEVNEAPVLPTIADKTLDEGGTYVFTSTATDVDLPANKLTYSLTAGPPSATIGTDGKIRWTTTESDGPGTYTFTVKVQDDGQPSLNDTKSFKVTLKEVNAAPVLPGIATETIVHAGQKVAINATASDSDIPANKLTYTLTPGNVVGVSFDKNTGLLSWTPSGAQVGDYPFEVTVTDDGVPAASDSASFTIRVKPPPELSLSVSGAVATLEWNAVAGTTYKVQFKDDLSAASWTLLREVTATGVTATTTDSIGPGKQRFYRVAIED